MASSRYVPAPIGRHRHPKSNLGKVAGERKGGQSGEDLKIQGVNTYPLVIDSREPDLRPMAATPRNAEQMACYAIPREAFKMTSIQN